MYYIDNLPSSIEIGYTGEEKFRTIQIDMSAWMELIPNGVPSIVHIRPGEGPDDAYIATTTFADNILSWEITANDMGAVEGTGIMQVWLEKTQNTTLLKRGKSATVSTIIRNAINDAGDTEPPARTMLLNLEAEAETLEPGSSATAEWEHEGYYGDYTLKLGIPKGDKGDKGDQGDPAPASSITAAVDAYLEENFTNPSNPPLDRTLASSSSAAPADMVGDIKSALDSDFNNIVKEIGRVGIALETSNLSNMGVSSTTGEQMGENSKRISNINLFPIVPNMPLYIENGTSFLKPYIYYFKNGTFVNYDSSYTAGKTYDADAIRILFFKNPSTADITAAEVASGFTIYQKVASGSYDSRLKAAEEKYPDIDNRFCDFQIPFRFGQLNTSTGAILVSVSTTTRLVSKLTKKGLFNYIVRTESGINYYVGYYNASKVFQKAVGYNTGDTYQLEDYPYICVMLAKSNGSAFTSTDCGIYLSETNSIRTIQMIDTELNKNKKKSLASIEISRISQFISTPSEDSDKNTIVTSDGGDSYSTAGQWIALFMNKIRIENIANKYLKWEKIQIKWDGDDDYTDIPKANCRCFVNTSFTFTGATDIDSGEMVLVDDILANYTDGELYIGATLSPVFAPTHVYQDGSTWHIDPFTARFVAYVYDDYYGAVKAHIADQLSNGLTGEEIAQAIENNGANDYSLIAYGDSLTTGAGATDSNHTYWAVCAEALNMKNRIGFGYGGSKSRPIAFTAGALTGYVPPNTRSFALKFADLTTDISINANVLNGKTVIIGDDEYIIGQTGDTAYTLPNTYTPVGYWVPVTVKNSRYTADVYIIWVGTNDGSMQWDIVDAMIAKLPHKRYVVMGLTRIGTDTSIEDEKKGYEKYGSHYLNIRMQIINSAFSLIGKTPTAEDTTAMNAGLMPPSLLYDNTHFNDDGYEAVGKLLAMHIKSLGYKYQTEET